ncbi:hypothetical protein Cgig2_018387 [Carnegiea gigantea]|uniref:Transposase n=1 Tax=Carnegiea gigantea TaxID=171969 RepID=A0A9Q1JJZ0_9CARY|nr:hypothetical protein Cgig2_018387 [Carnegiea gigantea]
MLYPLKHEFCFPWQSKFVIPNQVAESYALKSIGGKWSNFKADHKLEHYELNRGNVSAIMNRHRPDCVPKDQWISLVTYSISDKGKTVNGVEPSRAHVYVDTHKDRKTRPAPMDEKSKQAVVIMKEVVGEERRGRVLGLGLGPSSLAALSSTQYRKHLDDGHDQCNERIEFLEAENKRLQDKLIRLEGQQTEVLAEIARLRALVDDSMTNGATLSNSIQTQNGNVSLFVFNVFYT